MADYYFGLDIGTNSVGWAVTDFDYNLKKFNGKAMWGARLFDTAQPASVARAFRVARHRRDRQQERIEWLKSVFRPEVEKIDPTFFTRLQESRFLEVDKNLPAHAKTKQLLFADKNFNDKDYHKKYPTIYHLRQALMTDKGPFDIRLVYLALHHILKYRGHFLLNDSVETFKGHGGRDFSKYWQELSDYLKESTAESSDDDAIENDALVTLPTDQCAEVEAILISTDLTVTDKARQLVKLLNVAKNPQFKAVCELVAGRSVNLENLFADENLKGADPKNVCLRDSFDEKAPALQALLDERFALIEIGKKIYDYCLLRRILKEHTSLSEAKIALFEQHKKDLARLKAVVKRYIPKDYRKVFKPDEKLNNYAAYSGHQACNGRCKYEDFSKFIRSNLKEYQAEPDVQSILTDLENEKFLPLQTSTANGVIPHQIHEVELMRILENASRYLPFLNQQDELGLSLAEKIHQMFAFKRDYYVGPVNTQSKHSWVVRNTFEKIYPWNYDRVIDLDQTAAAFIEKLVGRCTYIGEEVLPMNSLMYTKFLALNLLNKIKVNGIDIDVQTKQQIYNHFVEKGRKITLKNVEKFLRMQGLLEADDTLSGMDVAAELDVSVFKKFHMALEEDFDEKIVEELIKHIVIFGDAPERLNSWVGSHLAGRVSPEHLQAALKIRLTGWGRLSAKFLTGIYASNPETGEFINILEAMWQTNDNLMELLGRRWGFMEAIEAYNRDHHKQEAFNLKNYLDNSYASPAIKRSIHQTFGILDEITKVCKGLPKRVFLEVTREDGEKVRTVSRRVALQKLYETLDDADARELRAALAKSTDSMLRKDKLYLYYTQLGRCMYSGERINLSELDSRYDIDHILPFSKSAIGNMDNCVLVRKDLNQAKSDHYPLPQAWRQSQTGFWNYLQQCNLISQTKLQRLTSAKPLTDEDLAGFVESQLVQTSQSVKLVANAIKAKYGDAVEVVYVKARHVSQFRNEQGAKDLAFVKCRAINHHHHAKDAYLNIVVGNVWRETFGLDVLDYIRTHRESYSLNHLFERNVKGAWTRTAGRSLEIVRKVMRKNNVLVTRLSQEGTGALYDQNITPKSTAKDKVNIKTDERFDVQKYGGYNSAKMACACVVDHVKRGKSIRSAFPISIMDREKFEKSPEEYLNQKFELHRPQLICSKIKIDSQFEVDGYRGFMSGRSENKYIFWNSTELILSPEWERYINPKSRSACLYSVSVMPDRQPSIP